MKNLAFYNESACPCSLACRNVKQRRFRGSLFPLCPSQCLPMRDTEFLIFECADGGSPAGVRTKDKGNYIGGRQRAERMVFHDLEPVKCLRGAEVSAFDLWGDETPWVGQETRNPEKRSLTSKSMKGLAGRVRKCKSISGERKYFHSHLLKSWKARHRIFSPSALPPCWDRMSAPEPAHSE